MQANHVLRAAGGCSDGVDVKVGRVGGQHGTGLAHAVQLAEHGLLYFNVFKHGFDHQVHLGDVGVIGTAGVARHHGSLGGFSHAALGHQAVVDLFHVGAATGDGLGIALDHGHGQTGIQRGHGNARTHGAATDHGNTGHGAWLRGLGFRHLGHFTLGKEGVDEAGALRAVQAFDEQRTLTGQAFVKRQLHGGLHAFDDLEGRKQAARFLRGLGLLLFQPGQRSLRFGNRQVAGAAHGGLGGEQFSHIGQACGLRVGAFNQFVHQTSLQRSLGLEVLTAEHHGRGRLHAHQARCALRAARAGQQAQVHFGQAHRGGGQCQAVVGRQGHFQPATQRCAVQHGHHGLVRAFDGAADLGQCRGHGRLAKFANVGPGDEGLACAHQQHGGHGRVGLRLLHGGQQALAHGSAEGVDRWVVDGDHQHVTMQGGGNNGRGGSGSAHAGSLLVSGC